MSEPKLHLLTPTVGAVICLQTEQQTAFIADEEKRRQIPGGESFQWDNIRRQGEDFTRPRPVSFQWEGSDETVTLELAKTSDFTDLPPVPGLPDIPANHVRSFRTDGHTLDVYNLEIGQTYYWRVRCKEAVSETASFSTAEIAPRWIRLDNCSNVRDIGGWRTVSGQRIRQGYLYRTGEFDTHMNLTPDGIRTALDVLGVRTDLDQRGEALGKVLNGVLEPYGVRRILVPMQGYDSIFDDTLYRQNLAHGFRLLCDPANWPLCFHCWGGADRGGTLSLLLEGALGVSRENLILDYELTSLSIWGIRTRNYEPFDNMMKRLDSYSAPSATLQENIDAFLLEIGVLRSDLECLRRNLLEA